jgi:hypothetical protein
VRRRSDQLLPIARTAVGQFPFGLRPDSLIRIQFRRIGWKVFDVQAAMPPELFDQSTLVGSGVASRTMTGPGKWRSSSRGNTQTSSCPMLS